MNSFPEDPTNGLLPPTQAGELAHLDVHLPYSQADGILNGIGNAIGQLAEDISSEVERQNYFYRRVGVSRDVMTDGPNQLSFHKDDEEFDEASYQRTFWEYGPDVLRDRFGVKGIGYFGTPGPTSSLGKLVSRAVGISCDEVEYEQWICTGP